MPQPSEAVKYKPYSPFQNTTSKGEYAVARLDDLVNWGRKVCTTPFLIIGYVLLLEYKRLLILIHFMNIEGIFATQIFY